MRSFSDYRKHCIRESLNQLTARGSSEALFDILRLDLLEAAQLPELLSESAMANSDFNRFRKDYQVHSHRAINTICNYGRAEFYDAVLAEADATMSTAMDHATAYRMLRDELKVKLSQMVKELKLAVSGAVSSRDTDEEDADADPTTQGGPAGATGSPIGGAGPTGTPTGPSGSGSAGSGSRMNPGSTGTSPGPMGGSGSAGGVGGGPTGGSTGSAGGPTVRGAFGDLMTALRPKDGWMKGLGRVVGRPFRDIGRYIKKNWYDENRSLIESILNEQNTHVLDLIDKFEKDILQWFDQRSTEIAAQAGINLNAAGVASSGAVFGSGAKTGSAPNPTTPGADATASNPATPTGTPQDFVPVGTKAQKQEDGTDPSVVDNPESEVNRAAAAGDPKAQQIVYRHYENLMAGCKELGISVDNITKNWSRHQGKDKDTPSGLSIEDIVIDGKPASSHTIKTFDRAGNVTGEQPIGSKYKLLLGVLVRKAAALHPEVAQLFPREMQREDSFPKNLYRFLSSKITGGLPPASPAKPAVTALLLGLGAMKTGLHRPAPTEMPPEPNAGGGASSSPVAPAGPASTPVDSTPSPKAPQAADQPAMGDRPVTEVPKAKADHNVNMLTHAIVDKKFVNNPNPVSSGKAQQIMQIFGGPAKVREAVKRAIIATQEEGQTLDPNDVDGAWAAIKTHFNNEYSRAKSQGSTEQDQPLPPPQDGSADQPLPPPQDEPEVATQDQPLPPPQDEPEAATQDQPLPPPQDEPQDTQPEKPNTAVSDLARQIQQLVSTKGQNSSAVARFLIDKFLELRTQELGGDEDQAMNDADALEREFKSEYEDQPTTAMENLTKRLLHLAKQVHTPNPDADAFNSQIDGLGESYISKIEKYKKLIKESTIPVSATKSLREKLGLRS